MTFGTWVIVLSTVLYVAAGVYFMGAKNYGLAIAYLCYAGANVGLALTTKGI